MRQPDLWRPEKPRSYLSQNCFELLVKTITAFCNYACIAILDWIRLARTCPPSFSRMLGSELDSCKCTVWCSATNLQIIMSSIICGQRANCLVRQDAPKRYPLRRVVSSIVLQHDRFRP